MATADVFVRARNGIFPPTSPTHNEIYDDHARSLLLYALRNPQLSSSALTYILHHPAQQQPQHQQQDAHDDGSNLAREHAPSALHRAAQWNNAAAIAVLINFRSQFCAQRRPSQKDVPTDSRVHYSTLSKSSLLESVDQLGQSPLIVAVRKRSACSALVLLELRANVNASDYQNASPLHWAAHNGDKLLVRVLLAYSADINATDAFGCTALHRSINASSPFTVRTLCNANADVHARDRRSLRAIDYAPAAVTPRQQGQQQHACEEQGKQGKRHTQCELPCGSVDIGRATGHEGEEGEEKFMTRERPCGQNYDASKGLMRTRCCRRKEETNSREWSAAHVELKAHHRWSLKWCVRHLRVESMTPCVWALTIVGVTMLETSLSAAPVLMITLCRASFMLSFFLWSWFQYSDPGYVPQRDTPPRSLRAFARSLVTNSPCVEANDPENGAIASLQPENAPSDDSPSLKLPNDEAESVSHTMTCDRPGTNDNSIDATSNAVVTTEQGDNMAERASNFQSSPLQDVPDRQHDEGNVSSLQDDWAEAVSFWTSSTYQKRRSALQHLCDKCWIVQAPRTRHCRLCHACVEHFDHHCTFLGHCVGKNNHQIFVATNIAACVTAAIFLCCAIHNLPPKGDVGFLQYLLSISEQEILLFCLVTSMFVLASFTHVLATQVYLISRNQTLCEWSRFSNSDPLDVYVGERTFCEGSSWQNFIAFVYQRRKPV